MGFWISMCSSSNLHWFFFFFRSPLGSSSLGCSVLVYGARWAMMGLILVF